jgi:hypothetical protein
LRRPFTINGVARWRNGRNPRPDHKIRSPLLLPIGTTDDVIESPVHSESVSISKRWQEDFCEFFVTDQPKIEQPFSNRSFHGHRTKSRNLCSLMMKFAKNQPSKGHRISKYNVKIYLPCHYSKSETSSDKNHQKSARKKEKS